MQPAPAGLSRQLVLTLAFGTAASVATIYFNQPLLPLLGREFGASQHTTGLLVTLTQLGYAAGIFALVPLGDVLNKKKLILAKLAMLLVALGGAAVAPTMAALFAAHLAIGLFSTAAQDFVPLAADLAPAGRRGQVIGTVMSGLLLGILASRTFSGVIAEHFGWRAVFICAAGLIGGVMALVWGLVPSHAPRSSQSYPALMRSLVRIAREQPTLRLAVLTQGCMGALFSAFWTVLAFHLTGPGFQFSTATVGYFGLIGAAGALAAPLAGKLADRRGARANIPIAIGLTAVAFAAMALWPDSLAVMIAGAALFDLGVQMSMVSHQSIIYMLDPAARSRINAIFVSGLFVCFAFGSLAGNSIFASFGWRGLAVFCLACSATAYGLHRWTAAHAPGAPAAREGA